MIRPVLLVLSPQRRGCSRWHPVGASASPSPGSIPRPSSRAWAFPGPLPLQTCRTPSTPRSWPWPVPPPGFPGRAAWQWPRRSLRPNLRFAVGADCAHMSETAWAPRTALRSAEGSAPWVASLSFSRAASRASSGVRTRPFVFSIYRSLFFASNPTRAAISRHRGTGEHGLSALSHLIHNNSSH